MVEAFINSKTSELVSEEEISQAFNTPAILTARIATAIISAWTLGSVLTIRDCAKAFNLTSETIFGCWASAHQVAETIASSTNLTQPKGNDCV